MEILWRPTARLLQFNGDTMSAKELNERITDYLTNGGQFNPEYMDHDKVRDLLIDVQQYLLANDTAHELTDEWVEQYVDEQIQHAVSYQNDQQWWQEYIKTPEGLKIYQNTRLIMGDEWIDFL